MMVRGSDRPPRTDSGGAGVMEIHAATMESPIGTLTLAVRDEGVLWIGRDADQEDAPHHSVHMRRQAGGRTTRWVWEDDGGLTAPLVDAVRRYFQGDAEAFQTLPLAPVGTEFQLAVWEACHRIPFGETRTYGDLAAEVGRPQAARAIGGAMNRNPIPLVVPCHRVVGRDGALVGYGMGGTGVKRWLLEHERRVGP